MNNTEYKVDIEKLEEYIQRLIALEGSFPANKCQGAINERYTGDFEGLLNKGLDEMKVIQENFVKLIADTRKYMENFKSSLETNDEEISKNISRGLK